jgi:hypothetical protein
MEYRQRRINPQAKKKRVFTPAEEEPASPHRAGHYAGLHGEDAPYTTTRDVQQHLAPRQAYPSQKLTPKSAYRYTPMDALDTMIEQGDAIEMPDGILYRAGNTQYYAHNGPPPVPLRTRRTVQQQIPQQAASRQRDTEPQLLPSRKPRRRFHWLFFVGIALMVMLLGWVGLNAFGAWWQIHTNDSTYGRPRTFQMDAVVGHGDSPEHPSHFMVVNLNRHIIIIEISGGDVSKSIIYSGPVLLGDGQDLTPVTLSFADVNGDGKPDMILHILDQTIVFRNNGTKFVPPSSLASGGSNPPTLGG